MSRALDRPAPVQPRFIAAMHNRPPNARRRWLAMRALRFGLSLALAALTAGTASARDDRPAAAAARPTAGELDRQLDATLAAMIAAAEIGSHGEVRLTDALGDPQLLERRSGRYWQIS